MDETEEETVRELLGSWGLPSKSVSLFVGKYFYEYALIRLAMIG